MFSPLNTFLSIVLGLRLFNGLSAIDDVQFLQNAAKFYSPAVLKQLLTERINHEIGFVERQAAAIGLTQEQGNLCKIVAQALATLRSEVSTMDGQQVVCGDKAFANHGSSLIKQFDFLLKLFTTFFEAYKTPYLTYATPAYLSSILRSDNLDSVKTQMIDSIKLYVTDVGKVIDGQGRSDELEVLGQAVTSQLNTIITTAETWSKSNVRQADLAKALNDFQETIDVFYRQTS